MNTEIIGIKINKSSIDEVNRLILKLELKKRDIAISHFLCRIVIRDTLKLHLNNLLIQQLSSY